MGAEARRLAEVPSGRAPWRHWGPYLSERGWGTVREDYSPDGDAWNFFPHDHARSRSYRWNEDGLAGICDDRQTLCFAFAFWNGTDPILKERLFGVTGPQGNHGEDVKEYWWFLDSTPTHSWLRWRYMYPQPEFPYSRLVSENSRRSKQEPEFELLDTGVFETDSYWEITVDYAKAGPEEIYVRLSARNHGPEPAELQVLPTLWFRNTWSWSAGIKPQLRADGTCVLAQHPELGLRRLVGEGDHDLLFCENETNTKRLWEAEPATPYPKDGINDFVIRGSATVNPALTGTKAALRYRLNVAAGGTAALRLRLSEGEADFRNFEAVMTQREAEADEFYAALTPLRASADEARVMRQGFAGLLWSKQFYHYDVRTWLKGDPGQPSPPASRQNGRNSDWRHLFNQDVISMPDPWEYPWYAAWDLAFHCITLAHLDAEFAKSQLILLCREWFMHPNGQLPAYEWSFSDVNPPVHAWAALRVFEICGGNDYDFLERIFHKLLLNFTWWVNRKDSEGNNIFEGGFLGLDNIGPFDRSSLPVSGHLEQSDGTAWMAMYCLHLWEIALRLAERDRTYEDMAIKFFEHFVLIAVTLNDKGLWDEVDGFYYDVLRRPDGSSVPLRAHSMVGLIPLYAVTTLGPDTLSRLPSFARAMGWFLAHRPEAAGVVEHMDDPNHAGYRLLAIVGPQSLRRILARVLDPAEFLSDHGVRALSRWHRQHPLQVAVDGFQAQLDYEPAESTSGLFGGNSNWRGPVWFPVNYLLIEALRRYHRFLGPEFKVECPTGSGRWLALDQVADELAARLVGLFLSGPDGRRPVFGGYERLQRDPAWQNLLLFHEYFDGDSGAGLGASHQTGWTGLVANLIADRRPLD
ncbi:MAG: glucosidase [Candidatus Dormibacteraeota bacterium]|uniref:Glucosidase n=1 Tax=Candidatus Dormiibacter inghamiae TaxID=3127013 RepID=A0A934NEG1_9BACT|nr:glucosidase [Candidatus Dormibacteraeota bacterium]MBJ7606269.1 glucosidase [Candidatus Dormibacteraeota bacterium]